MADWKNKLKDGFSSIKDAAVEVANENLNKEKLTEYAEKAGKVAKDVANKGVEIAKEAGERYQKKQEELATWEVGKMATVANTGYVSSLHLVMMSIDEEHLMFTVNSRFITKKTEVLYFKWLKSAEFGFTGMRAKYDNTSSLHIDDGVNGETWANLVYEIPGEYREDGKPLLVDDKFTVQIYAPFDAKRKEHVFSTELEYKPGREFYKFKDRFLACWERAKELEK